MPRIVPATRDHALHVGRAMRQADVDEVRAASGLSPLVATLSSLDGSVLAWAGVADDGEPFAICGVAPYAGATGSPWLLATDRLYDHRAFFLRNTRPVVEIMLRVYPVLINYVDARHRDSIRWLMWAGFKIDKLEPHYGVERRPFFRFSKVHLCASP